MYAIVTAGGIPKENDPLFTYTRGLPKAMLDIGGRSMLQRVLDGLLAATAVEAAIVVGIDGVEHRAALTADKPLTFLDNRMSLVQNVAAGLAWLRTHEPEAETCILSSADIPHLEGYMVDDLVESCRPFDRLLYYTVATPDVIENRYPGSRRTYTRLKGGISIAGGDLMITRTAIFDTNHALWEKLTQARKHAWQIARLVGFKTLLKLIFRQLSVEEAAKTAGRILGSDRPIGVVFTPHAALAMDADKPHQVDLLRQKYFIPA